MPRDQQVVHSALPLDNRLILPKHFCERLNWMTGVEKEAWLFIVEPGRNRLLSLENVQNDPLLEPTLLMREQSTITDQPSQAKSLKDAAIIAQLIPVTIDLHRGSWRILIPEEMPALAPPDVNPRDLSILMPEGYIEIWYRDVLRRAFDPSWRNRR
jgi:hypothetical protein